MMESSIRSDSYASKLSRHRPPETLAELFCYLPTRRLRLELEKFRTPFEKEHGETPLGMQFSSSLPTTTQIWLLEHHPERYFDSLPPFVQGFIRAKMQAAHADGSLDDMPATFIRLFLTGRMREMDGRG